MKIEDLLLGQDKNILDSCVNKINTTVFGCGYGEKSLLVSTLNKKVLYVASDNITATKLYEQFIFLNKKVGLLTNRITNITFSNFSINNLVADINSFLYGLNTNDISIITPDFLTQKLINPTFFTKNILKISKNDTILRENLIKNLVSIGYNKVDVCSTQGQFCVKGDIIDIFAVGQANPVRISFFDDEVENLNTFVLESFEKLEDINSVVIIPNTLNFSFDNDAIKRFKADKNEKLNYEAKQKLDEIYEQVELKIESNNVYDLIYLLPYNSNFNASVLDYLSEDYVVVYDEPKKIIQTISNLESEAESSFNLLYSSGELNKAHQNFYINIKDCFKTNLTQLSFQSINSSTTIFEPKAVFNVNSLSVINYNYNFNQLIKDLNNFYEDNFTIVLFALDSEYCVRLADVLKKNGFEINTISQLDDIKKNSINIIDKPLTYSVALLDSKLLFISSQDLTTKKRKNVIFNSSKRKTFVMPKIGDYVVHDTHGIGLCDGIKTLKINGYEKDYLVIKYRGSDVLYLPTENVDNISLYLGDDKEPKLNKLGGQEFEKAKARVKENVSKIALELVKLYNERKNLKGFVYPPDTPEMKEFEESFAYSETADQLRAVSDIKLDMESGKVMDRLICGDVGYGKTEVALRAAFKTILSGKQVALLCPTTILCEQHFNTIKSRFSPYAISYAKLNRFQTKKEQNDVANKLKEGKIDIVCGTHRLLSSDINFANLGLLILDEEQRFGVKDKEKIKQLKANVNVLTLSATPIPRTLHMSMVGIRDISTIETPPNDRLPVQTYVTEFSNAILTDAVNKELNRNGQVLIVYNRVETILDFANKIRELFPNINVGVAHGQMPEKLLEDEILKVYNGITQILVATTLIENGIDLPNANTLFVMQADSLGLSQLYQLRGRVGRSNKLGYAYFTYDQQKRLTEESTKRLQAIQEFTSLGSGFKIAMRDLEIRGAGNVLGGEQHGHMEKVGYDMYCKLLNMAIKEINGQNVKQYKDVKINISLDATVPSSYCENSDDRIKIYSLLSNISSLKELDEAIIQIDNAYGVSPVQVYNLGLIALVKNLSMQLGVSNVTINGQENYIIFYSEEDLTDKIKNAFKFYNLDFVINFSKMPIIYLNFNTKNVLSVLTNLIKVFLYTKK